MLHQQLKARDPARHNRASTTHRLEQHHPKRGALTRRAVNIGGRVVAWPIPIDAPSPVDVIRDIARNELLVARAERPVANHDQPYLRPNAATNLGEGTDHRVEPVARIEATQKKNVELHVAEFGDRVRLGREVAVIDAVRDHGVLVRKIGREGADAGFADHDLAVETADHTSQDRRSKIKAEGTWEDGMEGANCDRRLGRCKHTKHWQNGAIRRVYVDDINLELLENLAQLAAQQRIDNVIRLRGIAIAGERRANADDLKGDAILGVNFAVDNPWRAHNIARHHGYLVPASSQLRGLAMDVLGNPAEMRVVIVGDDGDPHALCIVASPSR